MSVYCIRVISEAGVCLDCVYSNPIEEQQDEDGSSPPAAAAASPPPGETADTQC